MREDPNATARDTRGISSYSDYTSKSYDDTINTSIYIFQDTALTEVERDRNTVVQIAHCQLRLHDLGLPLAKQDLLFLDTCASDSNSTARHARRYMLAAIAKGAIDVVVVETIGHLGATSEDQVAFCAECHAAATEVHTASEGKVRLAIAPFNEVMRACGDAHQDDEPLSMEAEAGFGNRHRCPVPFGYARDPAAPGQLTIDMTTSSVLIRVVDAFVAGVSPQTIAGRLRDECVPAPSTPWTASAVARLLRSVARNPIYSRGSVMTSRAAYWTGIRLDRRTAKVTDSRLAIIDPSSVQLLRRKLASERGPLRRLSHGWSSYRPHFSDCPGQRRWSRKRLRSDGSPDGYASSPYRP